MNVILGSGLNALLARHLLGSSYRIVSAGPSRFYRVNPSSTDNFIYASDLLRPLENQLRQLNIDTKRYPYQCCWSNEGNLSSGFDKENCAFWLAKIYNLHVPDHLRLVYPYRMNFEVYGTRVNQLYAALYQRYYEEFQTAPHISNISKFEPHKIVFESGQVIEYENCISTIPLDDLCGIMDYQLPLNGVDVTTVLLETSHLDFEGYNQVFVVDPTIQFFKAIQVKENQYVFSFVGRIENPGLYLSPYIHDFDLISGFFYPNCLPAGVIADTKWLAPYGVIPLGMSAQWDPAMDVSSCLHRLLKIADGSLV